MSKKLSLLLGVALPMIPALSSAQVDFRTIEPPVGQDFTLNGYLSKDGLTMAGYVQSGVPHQFRYNVGTSTLVVDAQPSGSYGSQAFAISPNGTYTTGYGLFAAAPNFRAYKMLNSGSMSVLAMGTGTNASFASAIADDGTVAGRVRYTADNQNHAYVHRAFGGYLALNQAGETTSDATDITADGTTVIGWRQVASATTGWTWTSAGFTPLVGLPGHVTVTPTSISGDGSVIVGTSNGQAVRWVNGGSAQTIGVPDFDYGYLKVSQDGQWIVGNKGAGNWIYNDFYGMQDLATLMNAGGVDTSTFTAYSVDSVESIGDRVAIAGSLLLNRGDRRAFYFSYTPVPEPATLLVLAGGGLVVFRKRWSKRSR